MSHLEVYKELSGIHDVITVRAYVYDQIQKYWRIDVLDRSLLQEKSFKFKANLKDFWEWAVTEAMITITNEDGSLILKAEGVVKIGKAFIICAIIGIFTGFLLGLCLVICIMFFLSKEKPKNYLEEIFNSVAMQHIGLKESYNSMPIMEGQDVCNGQQRPFSEIVDKNNSNLEKKIYCPKCNREYAMEVNYCKYDGARLRKQIISKL